MTMTERRSLSSLLAAAVALSLVGGSAFAASPTRSSTKPAAAKPAAKPAEEVPMPAAPEPAAPAPASNASQQVAPGCDGPPNPYLLEAKDLYANFMFDGIIAKLDFAQAVKGITNCQKVEVYKLMAFTYAAFDDSSRAETSFLKLLLIDPQYELTGASPKIRQMFTNAQKTWKAMQAVKLKHLPPKVTGEVAVGTVDVTVTSGVERVKGMTLHFRPKSEKRDAAYSQMPMKAGDNGSFTAPVPNVFPGPKGKRDVEYFIRARGEGNEVLAGIGDDMTPLEMKVEAEPYRSTPFYKNPWVWTGAAATVAMGVATFLILDAAANEHADPGNLGLVELP